MVRSGSAMLAATGCVGVDGFLAAAAVVGRTGRTGSSSCSSSLDSSSEEDEEEDCKEFNDAKHSLTEVIDAAMVEPSSSLLVSAVSSSIMACTANASLWVISTIFQFVSTIRIHDIDDVVSTIFVIVHDIRTNPRFRSTISKRIHASFVR